STIRCTPAQRTPLRTAKWSARSWSCPWDGVGTTDTSVSLTCATLTGAAFFRAVPVETLPDRKRAFWRIGVHPNRVIQRRVPTSGPTASECRPIRPQPERQITAAGPHIRHTPPESSGFCITDVEKSLHRPLSSQPAVYNKET